MTTYLKRNTVNLRGGAQTCISRSSRHWPSSGFSHSLIKKTQIKQWKSSVFIQWLEHYLRNVKDYLEAGLNHHPQLQWCQRCHLLPCFDASSVLMPISPKSSQFGEFFSRLFEWLSLHVLRNKHDFFERCFNAESNLLTLSLPEVATCFDSLVRKCQDGDNRNICFLFQQPW